MNSPTQKELRKLAAPAKGYGSMFDNDDTLAIIGMRVEHSHDSGTTLWLHRNRPISAAGEGWQGSVSVYGPVHHGVVVLSVKELQELFAPDDDSYDYFKRAVAEESIGRIKNPQNRSR